MQHGGFTIYRVMIARDLHIHTTYCDGNNTPEEMVLAAIDWGLEILGFSGHSYTSFDESWCMSKEGTLAYKKEIADLKIKYANKIKILCGTEQDLYSDQPVDDYDYFIGSVHYIRIPDKGQPLIDEAIRSGGYIYFNVDDSAKKQLDGAEAYFNGDIYALAENYFAALGSWADRKIKPDIIGHFDLITKFNEQDPIYDETESRYRAAWQKAADKLLKLNVPFEINTGAISRGYRTSPYPSFEIQEYIASKGGKFIMSSDSHSKDTLLYKFDEFERKEHVL